MYDFALRFTGGKDKLLELPPPSDEQLSVVYSTESITLENCTSQMETALEGTERETVHFLHRESFITDSIRNKILHSSTMMSEEEKAGELVSWIKKRVKQDRTSYYTLVNELKRHGNRYWPILAKLEAEYTRQQRTGVTRLAFTEKCL